jgi:hypothetical protein
LRFLLVREIPLAGIELLHNHQQLHTIDFTLGADSVTYARALKLALESLPLLGSLYIDCEGNRLLPSPSDDNDGDTGDEKDKGLSTEESTWRLPSLRRITLTDVGGELPFLRAPVLRAATIERRTDHPPNTHLVHHQPNDDNKRIPLVNILQQCQHQLRELEVIDDDYVYESLRGAPAVFTNIRLLEIPSPVTLPHMNDLITGWSQSLTRLVIGCSQPITSPLLIDVIASRLPQLVHLTLHGCGPYITAPPYQMHDIVALATPAAVVAVASTSTTTTSVASATITASNGSDSKREKGSLHSSLPSSELIYIQPSPSPSPPSPSPFSPLSSSLLSSPSSSSLSPSTSPSSASSSSSSPPIIHHRLEEIHCDLFVDDSNMASLRASFVQLMRRCPVLHSIYCDPIVMASPPPTCDMTVAQWLLAQHQQ